MSFSRGLIVSAFVTSLAACGDSTTPSDAEPIDAGVDAAPVDAPADAAAPDAPSVTGIRATVAYAGTASGTLLVAAFTSVPPMGPPVGLAQRATPSFPETVTLDELAPGQYFVLALLDVAPSSPSQPGPEDRLAWSAALIVVDGQAAEVAITIEDAE